MAQIQRGGNEWNLRVKILLQKQAELITKNGYTVQGVFPTQGDIVEKGDEYFFYSIGFFQYGWPEVLMFGNLSRESVQGVIHDIYALWKKEGRAVLGEISFPDLPGGKLRVNLVSDEVGHKYVRTPRTFKGDEDYQVAQILWPDNGGNLPDDPGYSPDPNIKQLILPKL